MKKIGVIRPKKYSMRWRENRIRNNSNLKSFVFSFSAYIVYDKSNNLLKTNTVTMEMCIEKSIRN